MKKLAIFDMDGTLADTSEGIFNSIRYTQKMMNLPEITHEQMLSHVGPPMEESYAKNFGLSGTALKKAVSFHKEYAMKQGYRELKVYRGIPELLQNLRENGILLAVATLKAQHTADMIAREYFGGLFSLIVGAEAQNPMSKAEILQKCMESLKIEGRDSVLIGDSIYDAKGAQTAGIDFIAVTYGFGFHAGETISARTIGIANDVEEIKQILLNN